MVKVKAPAAAVVVANVPTAVEIVMAMVIAITAERAVMAEVLTEVAVTVPAAAVIMAKMLMAMAIVVTIVTAMVAVAAVIVEMLVAIEVSAAMAVEVMVAAVATTIPLICSKNCSN